MAPKLTGLKNIEAGEGSDLLTILNIMNPIGEYKIFHTYKDRTSEGLLPFAFNNAVSRTTYPDLWAEVGHEFNQQHVDIGDDDLSADADLFYPTPIPGNVGRVGLPPIEFTDADVVDSGAGYLQLNNTGLHSTFQFGTAFRFELISGTAPTGLVDGTIYYGAFGEDYMLFHTTEQDAVDVANRVSYTDSGSGSFRLTQVGLNLASRSNSIHEMKSTTSVTATSPVEIPDDGSYNSNYLTLSAGGSTRQMNIRKKGGESRGPSNYEFKYIRAKYIL